MAKGIRTRQKELADSIFAMRVRMRGACERCGRKPPEISLQCSHIVSRKYMATRWDFDNALALCFGCHHWWHMRPLEAEDWCRELIGDDLFDDLKRRARAVTKVDYADVLERLTRREKSVISDEVSDEILKDGIIHVRDHASHPGVRCGAITNVYEAEGVVHSPTSGERCEGCFA